MRIRLYLGQMKKKGRYSAKVATRRLGRVGKAMDTFIDRTMNEALSSPRRLPLRQAIQQIGCAAKVVEELRTIEIPSSDVGSLLRKINRFNKQLRVLLNTERRRSLRRF